MKTSALILWFAVLSAVVLSQAQTVMSAVAACNLNRMKACAGAVLKHQPPSVVPTSRSRSHASVSRRTQNMQLTISEANVKKVAACGVKIPKC